MTVSVKVSGVPDLKHENGGWSGNLTVTISGGGISQSFAIEVPIQDAPSREAAQHRALTAADEFCKVLLAQVSKERARIEGGIPPIQGHF